LPKDVQDPLGAFVPHGRIERAGGATGPLAGATLAVKDIFDVEGTVTGRGNPDWLASNGPAAASALAVQALLDAGAHLVGKTVTEELAFGVIGINPHYGVPENVAAPGRVPGGSSSGSAAAVGAGVVDLALGSDTGGSVRIPASYNGILGMRPSHGRISLEGAMPLAPSFDTVGWFARDPALFVAAGRVLLDDTQPARPTGRLLLARDAFARVEPAATAALQVALADVEQVLGPAEPVTVSDGGLDAWYDAFRTVQGVEAWAAHGLWIEQTRPRLGPQCARRFRLAAKIDAAAAERARTVRAANQPAARCAPGRRRAVDRAERGRRGAARRRHGQRARSGARSRDRDHQHRRARRAAAGQPAAGAPEGGADRTVPDRRPWPGRAAARPGSRPSRRDP
jgi:amidase